MSSKIPRLSLDQMSPELAQKLRPRVERLGYLGEFFQCLANEPKPLLSFMQLTEDLKDALPDNLTEVVALTVAKETGNDYERHQHERLALKLGFTKEWIVWVLSLLGKEASGGMKPEEAAVQRLALAMIRSNGKKSSKEVEAVVKKIGPQKTVAVLLLVGRYMAHALAVNALELKPPVPSPFEDAK